MEASTIMARTGKSYASEANREGGGREAVTPGLSNGYMVIFQLFTVSLHLDTNITAI